MKSYLTNNEISFIISLIKQQNTLRNCVMVARLTLTQFVWVQILVPQPN